MAKAKKRRFRRYFSKSRRRSPTTIPLAPVIGLASTLTGNHLIQHAMNGDFQNVYYDLRYNVSGVDADGKFNAYGLLLNWLPTIAGMGVHMAASKFGLNRMLAKSKVPYVRI